jgi:DNA-binding CsgD family transcriptional regulator
MGNAINSQSNETETLLTLRQRQVLQLAVDDSSAKEIAQELAISVRTVEGHLANLRNLAGVNTLPGLTAWAVAHGVVSWTGSEMLAAVGSA